MIADDDANETELSLDNLDSDSPAPPARDVEEIYDLPPLDEVMAKATMLLSAGARASARVPRARADPSRRARAGCHPGCR